MILRGSHKTSGVRCRRRPEHALVVPAKLRLAVVTGDDGVLATHRCGANVGRGEIFGFHPISWPNFAAHCPPMDLSTSWSSHLRNWSASGRCSQSASSVATDATSSPPLSRPRASNGRPKARRSCHRFRKPLGTCRRNAAFALCRPSAVEADLCTGKCSLQ